MSTPNLSDKAPKTSIQLKAEKNLDRIGSANSVVLISGLALIFASSVVLVLSAVFSNATMTAIGAIAGAGTIVVLMPIALITLTLLENAQIKRMGFDPRFYGMPDEDDDMTSETQGTFEAVCTVKEPAQV